MSKAVKVKGVKITTPTFRLSFPRLDKPEAYKGKGEEYYSISMLFNKSDDLSVMKKALVEAVVERFGKDKKKWPKFATPWRDGDKQQDYDGYEGMIYCSAKNKSKPVLVDRDKTKLESASKLYGGCYARAVLIVKAVESGGKWFLTLYLQGVQFVKDGEPFGSGVDVDSDFEDLSEDDDANDESNYDDFESDDEDELGF